MEIDFKILRHSAAHILAQAVKEIYPDVKLGIGPAIENGFYYDFEREVPFSTGDLSTIENRMHEIVESDFSFQGEKVPKEEAYEIFVEQKENYKLELLNEMNNDQVTIYRQGNFVDLCRGPHVPSTGYVKVFKLLSVAGAYWRGSEKNPMLQRIYGTAFLHQEELEKYLVQLEEAKRRDHRKLGKSLDLFSIHEEAGAGLIYWHPKGAIVRRIIEDFWKDEHIKRGYQLVSIPHIAHSRLFHTSGHYDFYRENMYVLDVDEDEYVLKPMNCPGHILIYKTSTRSYRDLPIRYAELGTVYRHERTGVLHGTLRVRGFTQDDAHIFCTPEQVFDEITGVIDLATYMLRKFGFTEYEIGLSVRGPEREKYAGADEDWERAEQALSKALEKRNLSFIRREGEAVFYGPKIDIILIDALGRGWQGPTIQFDFNLPNRFDVNYVDVDGKKHQVVMIHRALLGSLERFIGTLLEHYGGALPLWLSPVQVRVLPITDRQNAYGTEVMEELCAAGIRTEIDSRNEKIGFKIRETQLEKIPYMLVVGEREAGEGTVSLRRRSEGNLGVVSLGEFKKRILREVEEKSPASE